MSLRLLVLLCLLVVGVTVAAWLGVRTLRESTPPLTRTTSTSPPTSTEMPDVIRRFCGDCHRLPSPDYFPKDAWYAEVQRGFKFYTDSHRTDLERPVVADVVEWYRQHAPETLAPTPLLPGSTSPVRWERELISLPAGQRPLVAGIQWTQASGDWPPLVWCDMGSGRITGLRGSASPAATEPILHVAHAATSKIVDLDQDGSLDLLISDLGSEAPGDHALGQLLYVPGSSAGKAATTLLAGVGRIADASAADFDSDGDLDLVVAEFGWQSTGSIRLLENVSAAGKQGQPLVATDYQSHPLDKRHGTIHVHPADLNNDGRMDFVALISQEFETVEAFLNEGGLKFRRETILPPQDPAYGSCGIELADLDQDGDLDIVYCNGDTLDSHLVKPYHGVHLMVNEGTFPFKTEKLLSLPGASDSACSDLDGDGDLDIALSAYLPTPLLSQLPTGTFDSLCWLEQTGPLAFQPHIIETGAVGHLGLAAGDFNADGHMDIAVGNAAGSDWGAIWWNRGAASTGNP